MFVTAALPATMRRLRRDTSGVAMLEFAFALPLVLGVGAWGIEVSNLALLNMRVSQIALNLADNASRVGSYAGLTTQQLREVDVNDVLQAVRKQSDAIDLTTRGRITLSSLENAPQPYDTAGPVQRIHWQRCLGMKSGAGYDSYYKANVPATAGATATSNDKGYDLPAGMTDGTGASPVNAPSGAAVMFVEVNYLTKPLFGTWLTSPARIHYIASFIVRDRRDFSKLWNPAPVVAAGDKMTCDRYTT